jgi:hypothetical protein
VVLGFPYHPIKAMPIQISFAINALFGRLDELRLRKAGCGSKWMRGRHAAHSCSPLCLRRAIETKALVCSLSDSHIPLAAVQEHL